MGTSAKIMIKTETETLKDMAIYFHYDGYPEHTLKFLYEFTERFLKLRGSDENYYLAQLLRQSMIRDILDTNEYKKDIHQVIHDKSRSMNSYGIMRAEYIDCDYLYIIDLDNHTYQIGNRSEMTAEQCKEYLTNLGE